MKEYKIPTMDDLKEIPKDCIQEGIVIDVDIKTWRELLNPEALEKFKEENRDQTQVVITYEVSEIKRDDKLGYYEKPATNSKLGRYMIKYNKFPQAGDKIKIQFDGEGYTNILLAK